MGRLELRHNQSKLQYAASKLTFNDKKLQLTTTRLLLREFVHADWESVQVYSGDPEVAKFVEWGPNTPAETKNFVRRAIDLSKDRPRQSFELAVIMQSTGKLIGGCGLTITLPKFKTAAIGYVLHRDFWGQGVATEAAQALVKFGFEQLGLHRIYATCDSLNPGSARVMQKCGMRFEGEFKEDMLIKGSWRDTKLYAILENEWRASQ